MTVAILLVALSVQADEPKQKRGDPTKDKPKSVQGNAQQILKNAIENGISTSVQITLPVGELCSLPLNANTRVGGLTIKGGTAGVSIVGGKIPGGFNFKGRKAGTANIVVRLQGANRPMMQLAIEMTFVPK